jgi:hypothetical protein
VSRAEFRISKIRHKASGFGSNRTFELTPDFFYQINIKISHSKIVNHKTLPLVYSDKYFLLKAHQPLAI